MSGGSTGARRAGETELGHCWEEESRGRPSGLRGRELPGEGREGGGGPSPGISGDHITTLQEEERSGTRGSAADRASRPLFPQLAGLAARSLPTLTPCGGAAPRPGATLLWWGRLNPELSSGLRGLELL